MRGTLLTATGSLDVSYSSDASPEVARSTDLSQLLATKALRTVPDGGRTPAVARRKMAFKFGPSLCSKKSANALRSVSIATSCGILDVLSSGWSRTCFFYLQPCCIHLKQCPIQYTCAQVSLKTTTIWKACAYTSLCKWMHRQMTSPDIVRWEWINVKLSDRSTEELY